MVWVQEDVVKSSMIWNAGKRWKYQSVALPQPLQDADWRPLCYHYDDTLKMSLWILRGLASLSLTRLCLGSACACDFSGTTTGTFSLLQRFITAGTKSSPPAVYMLLMLSAKSSPISTRKPSKTHPPTSLWLKLTGLCRVAEQELFLYANIYDWCF